LEKIWAYMTIQDMLKKRQVIDDAKTIAQFNEKALNLSLTVCFNWLDWKLSLDEKFWLINYFSFQREQYEFVTPLTSLVVVKPNSTSATADLRPADADISNGIYWIIIYYL
jgi:hypothetical protein